MEDKSLSEKEKEAILDLAIMAMYADSHLASSEDSRIIKLLKKIGVADQFEQSQKIDLAVGRVRRQGRSPEEILNAVKKLTVNFSSKNSINLVEEIIYDVLYSDGKIADSEAKFFELIKENLKK